MELVLHGVPVVITSIAGPEHSLLQCADEEYGVLFLRGETAGVVVESLTLRRCLVDGQIQAALSPHPKYLAHVAGPERWPGWLFVQNGCWPGWLFV